MISGNVDKTAGREVSHLTKRQLTLATDETNALPRTPISQRFARILRRAE